MRYRDDASVFVEAAQEWGMDDATVEDAAWACRPYLTDASPNQLDDGGYRRCSTAALDLIRPSRRWGRWERW